MQVPELHETQSLEIPGFVTIWIYSICIPVNQELEIRVWFCILSLARLISKMLCMCVILFYFILFCSKAAILLLDHNGFSACLQFVVHLLHMQALCWLNKFMQKNALDTCSFGLVSVLY